MANPNRMAKMNFGSMQQRQAAQTLKKALEEDPTVFQYDELYDEMDKERTNERAQAKRDRKPKYIGELMKTAERRQRENERRIEKQAQKDIEKEGDLYKDKEAFVTGAYKLKMEELRRLEEEEKRQDALDDLAEVTQQKDLSGFYRHIYRQTMKEEAALSSRKKVEKESMETSTSSGKNSRPKKNTDNEEKEADSISKGHHECPERGHGRRCRSRERLGRCWKPERAEVNENRCLLPETSRVAEVGEFQTSGLPTKLSEHPVWKRRLVGEALENARARYFDRVKNGALVPTISSEN